MLDKLCAPRPRSLSFKVWLLKWKARLCQLGPGSTLAGRGVVGRQGYYLLPNPFPASRHFDSHPDMDTHTLLSHLQVGKQK